MPDSLGVGWVLDLESESDFRSQSEFHPPTLSPPPPHPRPRSLKPLPPPPTPYPLLVVLLILPNQVETVRVHILPIPQNHKIQPVQVHLPPIPQTSLQNLCRRLHSSQMMTAVRVEVTAVVAMMRRVPIQVRLALLSPHPPPPQAPT